MFSYANQIIMGVNRMENVKVDVILVTYNRLECLKKALDALQKQNYPIHKIFVYNNASIDGTDKYLENSGFTTVKVKWS